MDCGKKYIEMCEKAKEIQKKWKPMEADFMYNYAIGEVTFIRGKRTTDRRRKNSSEDYNEDRFFWLPRQDQLQKMLEEKYPSIFGMLTQFSLFARSDWMRFCPKTHGYISMEQLWLAFVMKEKFNKIWSKEKQDWI